MDKEQQRRVTGTDTVTAYGRSTEVAMVGQEQWALIRERGSSGHTRPRRNPRAQNTLDVFED